MTILQKYPLTYVVILTWNQKSDTIECLESILKSDYENFRVLLIDNASNDGTSEYVKEHFPDVELIINRRNYGYAEGNNIGMKYAIEKGAEYIFILNNDTEIGQSCISKLVKVMQKDTSIGVAGATIYYYSDPQRIWFNGAKFNPRNGDMKSYSFKSLDHGLFNELIESDYAPGCGMLIRSSIVKTVGGLESKYFIYFEESDWCLRIKRCGHRIIIHPHAHVWHKISIAIGKTTPLYFYYMVRNQMLFIRRNVYFLNRINAYLRCIAQYGRQLRWAIRGSDKTDWNKAKAILMGFLHFLYGKYGMTRASIFTS